MRTTLFLITAASALCVAAPAAAQYGNYYANQAGVEASVEARVANLRQRIDAGIRAGTIDRREAYRLRQQLSYIDRLEDSYARGGFTVAERDDLNRRLLALRQDVRIADRGSWDRYDRLGWGDRDDRHTGRGGVYEGPAGVEASVEARIAHLRQRIDAGIRAGTINRREASRLYQQLSAIDRLEDRYARGGFSVAERRDLNMRLRALRQDVRIADRGTWDRYDRFAWDDRFDGYTGRGGVYEEVVCERRGGIIGFIEDITGTRDCFVVGQRVTLDLDPVPYRYRNIYRDRGDVIFRSDGRAIYEIDARTNTVLRVHRMN